MSSEATPTAPPRKRFKWLRRLIKLSALGMGLLIFTVIASFLIWSFASSREIAAELARIQAAGEPVDAESLDAYYPRPPADRDATPLWLDAIAALSVPTYEQDAGTLALVGDPKPQFAGTKQMEPIPAPGEPWDELDAAEAFLNKYAEALDKLHAAADHGGGVKYPLDLKPVQLDEPIDVPHSRPLSRAAKLLALEAYVGAHRDDKIKVFRAIRAIFEAAKSLENEPMALSYVTVANIDFFATTALADLLAMVPLSDEDLRSLQLLLRKRDSQKGLYRAYVGERVQGLMLYERTCDRYGLLQRIRSRPDLAYYLNVMGKYADAAKLSPSEGRLSVEEFRYETPRRYTGIPKIDYCFYGMGIPLTSMNLALSSMGGRVNTFHTAPDAAIAVELFRRKYGRLPDSLEDVIPEFLSSAPIDAFDGQQLRYLIGDDDFRVYSVGFDGEDGCGKPLGEDEDNRGDTLDDVFRVRLPKSQK